MGIKLKMVTETGQRLYVRIWWGQVEPSEHKGWGYHNAMQHITDLPVDADVSIHTATDSEYAAYVDKWPAKCEICDEPAPTRESEHAHYDIFYEHLYDEPRRLLQPGDVFYTPWMKNEPDCFSVVLPLKMDYDHRFYTWNNYQVASNCSHGNNQLHKCWEVSGNLPQITVAPSILYDTVGGKWHGFIRNGELVDA